MCGIAGLMQADGNDLNTQLAVMMDRMQHRGPDGEGILARNGIGIGMKRLAIIDVAGGRQPILNEDETIAIVCNGEIYNQLPLRKELEGRGHRFRTHSDVEVILHLYEESGEKCFSRLNGMFGAAIADFRRNRLVLARDPFGQKPLYLWRRPGGGVAFASELKAIANLPGFPRRISQEAIAHFLNFRYIPSPLTPYEGVEKLAPGTSMTVHANGKTETARYWQIRFPVNGHGRTDGGAIREKLTESVDRHLMSERPLGVFLSGGLDSASIVACMHDLGHRDIHTFTVGFDQFHENEFANARAVAQHFKTCHEELTLTPEHYWDLLDQVAYSSDEPMADSTMVPLYYLSQEARKRVVVVLSGEGSDELLGGYAGMEDFRRLFDRLAYTRSFRPLLKTLAAMPWPDKLVRKLETFASSDSEYLAKHPTSMNFVFDDAFRRSNCPALADCSSTVAHLSEHFAGLEGLDGVHIYLSGLIEWWLPDDLLLKADRMTMAHSIELRCPFLDVEFAEYCARLPLDEKVQDRRSEPIRKIALKRQFGPVLPDGIANQVKKGFVTPVHAWIADRLAPMVRSEILNGNRFGSSLFSTGLRENMLTEAMQGDALQQRRIWSLIVLNKWADHWL